MDINLPNDSLDPIDEIYVKIDQVETEIIKSTQHMMSMKRLRIIGIIGTIFFLIGLVAMCILMALGIYTDVNVLPFIGIILVTILFIVMIVKGHQEVINLREMITRLNKNKSDLVNSIELMKAKINRRVCQYCGSTLTEEEYQKSFCPNCGNKIMRRY